MTEESWFTRGVRFSRRYFSWILGRRLNQRSKKYLTQEYRDTLLFIGLDVEPSDILLFAYTSALLSFLFFFAIDLLVLVSLGSTLDIITVVLMIIPVVAVPLVVMNLVASYPKTVAKFLQIRSLGDIPEILSYLVMYLKLVPTLENSIKFAASESSTVLAWDLRKLMWDIEVRVYVSVDDAMIHFAAQWGRYSEYFKRSLHLIYSSVQQRDEASRVMTLDRALDVSLEGTKDTMHRFANKLHQPTVMLYSVGIMIPLSLVAMLPAAGLVGLHITVIQIFIVYDVLLPLIVLVYTRRILLLRPAAFNPPRIPADHPEVTGINTRHTLAIAIFLGTIIASPGIMFLFAPLMSMGGRLAPAIGFLSDPTGLSRFLPMTLFIIWGIATAMTMYCVRVSRPYKKVRDDIKAVEREFSDALYILGKRISEEKSPEESFLYAAQTMEGSRIAEVFQHTSFNLTAMHTTLRDALFSTQYGSLAQVYSDRVHAVLRLFVEGISKSQRAVSASLIRIADHLKQLQEVETKIRDMLYELTMTLRSTVTVFAPLIAGVTLAITTLISRIIGSLGDTMPSDAATLSPTLSGVSSSFMVENIRPEYFVLVIGVYLVELVVLLIRFTNGIDEGDDAASYLYSLGRTIPVTILVFSLTIILGQFFFSQLLIP